MEIWHFGIESQLEEVIFGDKKRQSSQLDPTLVL